MSGVRDEHGNRYTVRRALRSWRCEGGGYGVCVGTVKPGEQYVRHVTFPSDQIFDHVTVMVECVPCARIAHRQGLPEVTP